MGKRKGETNQKALFADLHRRKHPRLFLPKYLTDEANNLPIDAAALEQITNTLKRWVEAAQEGRLNEKETSLDAEFLQKIFGQGLGYKSVTEKGEVYHLQKNPSVAGAGIADGALGHFAPGKAVAPTVIIELKGAKTDLDHDKINGRTPVQQCWDYLNQLPDTQWGIVSNYVTVRLYNKGSPARAYEEFSLADFLDPQRIREFYYIFERVGLIGAGGKAGGIPRATKLLSQTQNQQRVVGDKLYKYYAEQRELLIGELMDSKKLVQDDAIRAAQKLLDRIIFMAFCEDRGLLPEKLIENTWKSAAPLARATNPRWQAFLDAFHAIDKGHPSLDLPTGYNGGLFKRDDVVDNLELEDRWADVFRNIGGYDFREEGEISVDVLGHLFERSITELEKMRVVGLFGKQAAQAIASMPKSAERKRFGIYYTPPQFTQLIVEETLGKLIAERVETLPDTLPGLHDRVKAMRKLKVVDPACGSGAFLIAAYYQLELAYEEIARKMRVGGHLQEALNLTNEYPDYILKENLYGVDLSAESVEITQLALWIRSARRGVPLTDLSSNIRRGNSLIRDKSVHPEAFDWQDVFPQVFKAGGFDAVIGNPPWERIKQQKREFFSIVPEVIAESNPAKARKLIDSFEESRPALHGAWLAALDLAARTSTYFRKSKLFPLTAVGDMNFANIFAEVARKIIAPAGRIGLLVPSGVATDVTTKDFFIDLVDTKTLIALYDFENKKPWFEDVHRAFKFSVLLMGGSETQAETTDYVFFAREIEDLSDKNRHIELSPKDLKLLNPNTRTCPIFRTKRDAELTKSIYKRVAVLVDRNRKSGGNPWGFSAWTMFHQSGDAELFVGPEELEAQGYLLQAALWMKGKSRYLPLYEAKMVQAYDHRAASVRTEGNWLRHGQTEETTLVEHTNPEFAALPRWWVEESGVRSSPAGGGRWGFLGFKDVSSATNQRTMIAAAIPWSAVTHHFPLIDLSVSLRQQMCFLGNLNTIAYDFIARQKLGGTTFGFYHLEQIPMLPPDAYDEKCPWAKSKKLEDWIAERVLKLTCTADDMRPLAEAAGFKEGVHKWKEAEAAQLRAELDAAYFHLYDIDRDDVSYILSTFQGVVKEDEAHGGEGETRKLIMEAYDSLK